MNDKFTAEQAGEIEDLAKLFQVLAAILTEKMNQRKMLDTINRLIVEGENAAICFPPHLGRSEAEKHLYRLETAKQDGIKRFRRIGGVPILDEYSFASVAHGNKKCGDSPISIEEKIQILFSAPSVEAAVAFIDSEQAVRTERFMLRLEMEGIYKESGKKQKLFNDMRQTAQLKQKKSY